uniref:Uncharacterized protein n=1 Tax=Avena sativa TaxID=4498 RepID=A0ACD5YY52_AVESA
MEVALVSAATGALKPVLVKLAALLGEKYKRFKKVHSEIDSLTRELAAMHAFLLKMSEEEDPEVQATIWMNEVRELSYDMEDSIDEFMGCVDDKSVEPDGFIQKIKFSLGKMKAHHRISNEINDLKKGIFEVAGRNSRYKIDQTSSKTSHTTIDLRSLAMFEHASRLVGIDEPKTELIKLLMEKDECPSTQQQVKVLSIFGSGGMGKTTLANQVYQELKMQFECRAFISVSRNPDMMTILRTLLNEVSNQGYANTEDGSIQQLIIKITDFLVDKRYFIVIDDIWDMKTLEVIKCAFPVNSYGSRIITTTRLNDVAHSWLRSPFNGHIYNIRPLSMAHSRCLFRRRLFNSEDDCPPHLEEVSEQILEKCEGLPLAVNAISGLLATKVSTRDQWDKVKNSIGRALERGPSVQGMIKILSLSYFDLPPHLKSCLLYLSIFPEDNIIRKDNLIKRWIAEGFIHEEGRYALHELGERCFNELVSRSLIQPQEPDVYGKVESCKIHDTILDFIISKSIEENFVTLVGVPNLTIQAQTKVRRLSLHVAKEGHSILSKGLVLSHVRSLNVFGDPRKFPSLDKFKHLRVLDLGDCYQLENHHLANLGRLFQLRHLNLRDTGVSKLPEQIRNLLCLEMLDLRGTDIRELPTDVLSLGKLAHLLLDNYVKLPDGLVKMQSLEMLEQVGTFEQSLNCLQQLGQLKNLRKLHLDFQDYDDTEVKKECMKAIVSSLCTLATHNLCSLTVVNDDGFLLKTWWPAPLSLQILLTWHSILPEVPRWLGSLVNLQQLRLEAVRFRQEDLHILGSLPALLILFLESVSSYGKLKVSGEVGFRCLKQFSYYLPSDAINLMFAPGSMPKLEKIDIRFHASGTRNFHFGIENLPCLITVKCLVRGCTSSEIEGAKAEMQKAASGHPNHLSLSFRTLII